MKLNGKFVIYEIIQKKNIYEKVIFAENNLCYL